MQGLFPRQDPIYQEYYVKQVKISKERLNKFPITNKFLQSFHDYERLKWKESKNKIFLLTKIYPKRFFMPDIDFILEKNKTKNQKSNLQQTIHYDTDHDDYPNSLERFERGLRYFIKNWNNTQLKEFKNRISNYDYFTSSSAFDEIMFASTIGESIGYEHVIHNPPLSNGKNGDVLAKTKTNDYYFELTSTTFTKPEEKIQNIFDDFAEFLGNMDSSKTYIMNVWINTLSFIHDDAGHIDEDKTKKMLRIWASKLHFEKLIGVETLLHLDSELYVLNNEKFLIELIGKDYSLLSREVEDNIKNQPKFKEWANLVLIRDLNDCPFTAIGCHVEGEGPYIHVNGNESFPSDVGSVQEKSFLDSLKRSILTKIQNHQFEQGKPAIIVLKASFWAYWYETDEKDFLKIKKIIEDVLISSKLISGVLIYSSKHENSRFIPNPSCQTDLNINLDEIKQLGLAK